jgi:hypothetical protein
MPIRVFGESMPSFTAATASVPQFRFDTVAGRNVVTAFLGRPLSPYARRLLRELREERAAFDDAFASFFFVVSDPGHLEELQLREDLPGVRCFVDGDDAIAGLYGLLSRASARAGGATVEAALVVMDRGLRGLMSMPLRDDRPMLRPVVEGLRRLAMAQDASPVLSHAPVLVVERVFEPPFCRRLIEHHARHGSMASGVMLDRDDRTVAILNDRFKRRRDCLIHDPALVAEVSSRLARRLLPQIENAFHYRVSHIERHVVARYDAAEGGFFLAHRDNTTRGTEHRKFAVTLNLNPDDYEGGDLRFPEFGGRLYRAPLGGAIVFSCSLLHEALPVTRGARYAYLPFLYGDADARLREQNRAFVTAVPERMT